MSGLDDLKQGIRFMVQSVERKTGIYLGIAVEYEIEVKVVTRLGAIPVRGVKLTIGAESWGVSDKDGCYKNGTAAHRKKTGAESLTIKATYENAAEQLRKEQVTVSLSEVDPDAETLKCAIKYEIPKVCDVMGTTNDLDFKTESDGTGAEGEIKWVTEGSQKILQITLALSTLSLAVPYTNQRNGDENVQTIPGDGANKDAEETAHDVGPFSGGVLCYPTSVSMILRYWGQEKTRKEVMQKTYSNWADSNFKGRPDRGAKREASAPTATNGTASSGYWLDTSANEPGYALYKPSFDTSWEATTATTAEAKYKLSYDPAAAPGADLGAGEIWKDTSTSPATFKKYVKRDFHAWTKLDEDNWRVSESGSKLWEWGWRELAVMDAFKPAKSTAVSEPNRAEAFLPLTKVAADDTDGDAKKPVKLPSDILPKYKEWLSKGFPFILATTATAGHMMAARGCVVNKAGEIEWLIVNDPYGNLAYRGTMVAPFKLSGTVGKGSANGADDVKLIQGVLSYLGVFTGEIDGKCAGTDEDALVKAIKAYQGGKAPDGKLDPAGSVVKKMKTALGATTDVTASYQSAERNDANATFPGGMKGMHAYYCNKTMGVSGKLRIKGDSRGYPRIEKTLTAAELAQKLTPGA